MALGARLGVDIRWIELGTTLVDVDVVVSTIPADVAAGTPTRSWRRPLLDAIYDPWPTPLATAVEAAGGQVISGLQMLLHQAFAQVEQFTGLPAPTEAMRAALAEQYVRRVSARIGVVFRPDFRPDTLQETASAAERAGLPNCGCGRTVSAGRHRRRGGGIASSETLTVGLGVLPAPLRNVVITAMEIATLDAMFPGRLRVGIGHGVQDWMRQAGAAVASPLTLMREYVTALGDLLAGRSVTVDGRYVRLADVGWTGLRGNGFRC